MAHMIPASLYSETNSPGEVEIFRRLKDDPDTSDWIILHSLDVANHRKQVVGEIDFVAIVPGKGVLCVEVKGCRSLRREHGLWYYGTQAQPDSRGPFKQASEAMQSIRARLVKREPRLSHVVFWTAVIMPYIEFAVTSEEWHPWQVVDNRQFRAQSVGKLFRAVLDQARAFLRTKPSAAWFRADSVEPNMDQCLLIAKTLRPDFEFFERPKSRVRNLQDELKRYTSEQFIALDAMEANARVAFSGPAGTGKTTLAIETARRSRAAGRKVLLLSYNRLLGRKLEDETVELQPEVTTMTLHRYMLATSGLAVPGRGADFWHEQLPQYAIDRLLESGGENNLFDELVIDEAQDILRESYLDFLDLSLKGGLASGRWRLFGDFEKQAIYDSADIPIDSFLQARSGSAPIYSLRVNCRNTPRVAEFVHLLGGLQPGYSRVLRPDDRMEPEILFYRHGQHQQQLLLDTLQQLYNAGYSGNDIVVLSPRAGATSAAGVVQTQPWKDRLKPFETAYQGGYIPYGSIHGFKGMEALVVIVTDMESIGDHSSLTLFYIAITRSLYKLVLLMHDHAKQDIRHALGLPHP